MRCRRKGDAGQWQDHVPKVSLKCEPCVLRAGLAGCKLYEPNNGILMTYRVLEAINKHVRDLVCKAIMHACLCFAQGLHCIPELLNEFKEAFQCALSKGFLENGSTC